MTPSPAARSQTPDLVLTSLDKPDLVNRHIVLLGYLSHVNEELEKVRVGGVVKLGGQHVVEGHLVQTIHVEVLDF